MTDMKLIYKTVVNKYMCYLVMLKFKQIECVRNLSKQDRFWICTDFRKKNLELVKISVKYSNGYLLSIKNMFLTQSREVSNLKI